MVDSACIMIAILWGRGTGCEYHVHEGGVCYKDVMRDCGTRDRDGHEEEALGTGKEGWSVNDDAELNAMAAHYVGKKEHIGMESIGASHPGLQSLNRVVERDLARQDGLRSKDPRPMHRAASTQSQAVSTRTTASSKVADLSLSKPLPPLPPLRVTPSTRTLGVEPLDGSSSNPSRTDSPTSSKTMTRDVASDIPYATRYGHVGVYPNNYDIESPRDRNHRSTSLPSLASAFSLSSSSLLTSLLENEYDYDHDRKEVHEDDVQTELEDAETATSRADYLPTSHLVRNFSFTALPKPGSYISPSFLQPHSPRAIVTISPNPFTPRSLLPSPISPNLPSLQPTSPTITPPYHVATCANLKFPPLIKRKQAPERGQDWVNQWDKLCAMQGTQGFGLRKLFNERKKSKGRRLVNMVGDLSNRLK